MLKVFSLRYLSFYVLVYKYLLYIKEGVFYPQIIIQCLYGLCLRFVFHLTHWHVWSEHMLSYARSMQDKCIGFWFHRISLCLFSEISFCWIKFNIVLQQGVAFFFSLRWIFFFFLSSHGPISKPSIKPCFLKFIQHFSFEKHDFKFSEDPEKGHDLGCVFLLFRIFSISQTYIKPKILIWHKHIRA